MAKPTKMIVIPIDGSQNALKTLDFVNLVFGHDHDMEVALFYVLPTLPPILVDDPKISRERKIQIKSILDKNTEMAQRILSEAKKTVLQKGFKEHRVRPVHKEKEIGIARDISNWAEKHKADAIIMSTQGRSRLAAFFMGEISRKVLEYSKACPVWIVAGTVKSQKVLVAVDSSENALRAADHAGFMLSATDCQITLFHTMRNLRRFVPKEVLENAPELEELWKQKAEKEIGPYMKKAQEMIVRAGFSENQIAAKLVDGSRSAASDILEEAKRGGYGTVFLGRRGQSAVKDYSMGTVACKVLEASAGMTVAIVP